MEWSAKSSTPPGLPYGLKHRFQLAGLIHVAGEENGSHEVPRERLHISFGLLVYVGDRKFRAESTECFGAAKGDRVLVGDPENKPLLACERL
jgi:hypothetical protein